MTREYLGYADSSQAEHTNRVTLEGRRPDTAKLPLLQGAGATRFEFEVDSKHAKGPAQLRIHAADQSHGTNVVVEVKVNGTVYEQTLTPGLGIQNTGSGASGVSGDTNLRDSRSGPEAG